MKMDGSAGTIEFTDARENEEITALPDWANACIAKWDEAKAAEEAAAAAAEAAAQAVGE